MPLTPDERREALAQMYRHARHVVDSQGGNLHTMRKLLGPELYRARIAEQLFYQLTGQATVVKDPERFREMVLGLWDQLIADTDLHETGQKASP